MLTSYDQLLDVLCIGDAELQMCFLAISLLVNFGGWPVLQSRSSVNFCIASQPYSEYRNLKLNTSQIHIVSVLRLA